MRLASWRYMRSARRHVSVASIWMLMLPLGLAGAAAAGDIVFSPDSKQVAYTSSAGLVMANIDGSATQVLADSTGCSKPAWSPDGRWIAFLRTAGSIGASDLWLRDLRKGASRRLGTGYAGPLSWREDSARLALVQVVEATGARDLVQFSVSERGVATSSATSRRSEPANSSASLFWSPATDILAYVAAGPPDVWLMDGGEMQQISKTGDVVGLGLEANAGRLWWARSSKNPRYILLSLYSFDLNNRTVSRATFPDRVPLINPSPRSGPTKLNRVAFSPDCSRIAIVVTAPGAPTTGQVKHRSLVYLCSRDGSAARMVATIESLTPRSVEPIWSPDGRYLAVEDSGMPVHRISVYRSDATHIATHTVR